MPDRPSSPRDPSSRQLLGLAWDVVQPWLGWICVGLGFLALIIGYFGVANETIVEKQLPYLLSGGLAGIALGVFGARLLLIQDLRRDSGRLDRLETMVAQLHGALLSRSDAPRQRTEVAAGSATLMALPTGTSFHTASCPMLTGKERAEPVGERDIASRSLVPCPLCEPAAVSA